MKSKLLTLIFSVTILLGFNYYKVTKREKLVEKVQIGMEKAEVIKLLGKSKPNYMQPVCPKCTKKFEQLYFEGNPSIWHGRLEDSLVICFTDKKVCDVTRYGL